MTIEKWARWVEIGEGDFKLEEALDIRQVPDLVEKFKERFFEKGIELGAYRGFTKIAQDLLPCPSLGYGLGSGEGEKGLEAASKEFRVRVESLPLKDGAITMSVEAFRLALVGNKALQGNQESLKPIFYSLDREQKKYILSKQPDLFSFRTPLPSKIGTCSLLEILWSHSPKDLLRDAALFGSDALFEVIYILHDMIPFLCAEDATQLEKNLGAYTATEKDTVAYRIIDHLIEIVKGIEISKDKIYDCMESLNNYCSSPDANRSIYNLIFPKFPLKRARALRGWLKHSIFKPQTVHIPLSPLAKFMLATRIHLLPDDHDPFGLMGEFDTLDSEEKKEFILEIVLKGRIEFLSAHKRAEFLEEVEKRRGQPFLSIFKLALLCIEFAGTTLTEDVYPRLQQRELLLEIQHLKEEDKKWFVENFLTHEGFINYYFGSQRLIHFFSIVMDLRNGLGTEYMRPYYHFLETKILEICPIEGVSDALVNLGMGSDFFPILINYVTRKIESGSLEEKVLVTCQKFFAPEDTPVEFILKIATLQSPSGKFLLSDPDFPRTVPPKFQSELQILANLIEPAPLEGVDPLVSTMKRLPSGLKNLLVEETPFSSFFHLEVMPRLLHLYKQGCIPHQEMFFFATRYPFSIFLEVVKHCPLDLENLEEEVLFDGYQDSIINHLAYLCDALAAGEVFSHEDFRRFLHRFPQEKIGEGPFILYLARLIPMFFNGANIQKIYDHTPMHLIPYLIHTINASDRLWFLDTRYEAVFSKNMENFSPEVLVWLAEDWERWFSIRKDVLGEVQALWQEPESDIEAKIELYDKTQNHLISFNQRFSDLEFLCKKIADKPEAEKILEAYRKLKPTSETVKEWLKKSDRIDLRGISDAITDHLLKGRVYSLEGSGWILEETRSGLKENPFTTFQYASIEERNAKIPLLNQEEMLELDRRRQEIAQKIDSLRALFILKKRQKLF
ncbi:hypothetical protein EB008_01715 [bacterium]|nr:hypothetical protein [bacterium]